MRHPLITFKFDRREVAGSLGDLGLFVPIIAGLIVLNGMNATVILLSAGLLYIAAGLYFRVPMPVQPFKAVASLAIAMHLAPSIVSAAGLWMALLLAVVAATPLATALSRVFKKPVIRGIQLIIGLFLIRAGYELLISKKVFVTGTDRFLTDPYTGLIMAIAVLAIILAFRKSRALPGSLAVLAFGIIIGIAYGGLDSLAHVRLGPQPLHFAAPSLNDFGVAFLLLVLPQLPMTLSNSVVATNDVSRRYFGPAAGRVTPRSLLTSLSIANIVAGLFGGMPLCHGSGGMTAHYKFGARTGASGIIIGSIFVGLALVFGQYALALLALIPAAVYAMLMIYLGIEHALLLLDLRKVDYVVPIIMGSLAIYSSNLLLALGCGYVLNAAVLRFRSPLPVRG